VRGSSRGLEYVDEDEKKEERKWKMVRKEQKYIERYVLHLSIRYR